MADNFRKLQLKVIRSRRVHWPRRINKFKIMSRHPFAVPVITFAVLFIVLGLVYVVARGTHKLPPVTDAKIVIITYDHQKQTVPTNEATVGALLTKLHIQLSRGDVVEPAASARINQDDFRINVYRAIPVAVEVDGQISFGLTAAKTPRTAAQQVGSNVYPEDTPNIVATHDFLREGSIGQKIVIDRATPVNVDLYGTPVVLRTHAKTVAGLMKEKGIKLVQNDQVTPAPSTPLSAAQHVAFIRTGTKVETVTEQIAMTTQTITDPSLAYGTKAVRQQGADGQQIVTYQVSLTNNVETGRTVIQKVVSKQPVTQVVVVGTSLSGIKGDMALAGIAPGDYEYVDYIVSHESGWRPDAGHSGTSGPYGLCQAYPGTKMASAGADWVDNPVTQLRWCSGYALGRYGSWAAAYNHWVSARNW